MKHKNISIKYTSLGLFDIFHFKWITTVKYRKGMLYVNRMECSKKKQDQDEISNVQYWPHLKADIV